MLNKYTNQFMDPQLEAQFERHLWGKQVKPILTLINLGILIVLIEEIIYHAYSANIFKLIVAASIFIFITSLHLIVQKWPQHAYIALFILFHGILFFQFAIDQSSDAMHITIMSSNQAIACMIIIYISKFKWVVVFSCSMFTVRILMTCQSFNELYIRQYLVLILLFIFIIVCARNQNIKTRMEYYLGLKDSQWEKVIPSLIGTPFVMFTYDNEQLRFNLKMTNIQEEGPILQSLLRNLHYEGISLEQYLFNRIRNNQCENGKVQLKCEINRKHIVINYSEFYLADHTFLIVLPGEGEINIKKECSQMFKKQIAQLTKFIGNVQQSIQLSVKQRSIHKMIRISSFLFEYKMQQLYQFGQTQCVEKINLHQFFNEISKVTCIKFKIDTNNHQFINGIKTIWCLFILQLLKYRLEQQVIQVYVESNQKLYIICKLDQNELEKDSKFIQLRQILCTDFVILQYGYMFLLAEEPIIPYIGYKQSGNRNNTYDVQV